MGVTVRTRKGRKGVIYWLDIIHNGVRHKETLKIPFDIPEAERKLIARRIAVDRESEIMLSPYGIPARKKSRNFIEYFQQYVDERQADNNKYLNTIRHFKILFGTTLLTTHVNDHSMSKWKRYLEDNFNGETPATMWSAFRAVVNHAVKERLFDRDPMPGVRGPKRKRLIVKQILYQSDLERLFSSDWPEEQVCRAFLLCCFTGMTRPEIVRLRWSQINLKEKKLVYYRAKNDEQTVVDLGATAMKLLPDRVSDKVFPHFPSDSYCSRVLKDWMKSVKIGKNISWYCARHTFAVLLLSNGTDLKIVADLMGHTSTRHTEKYLNFVNPLKREAVDRLPKF